MREFHDADDRRLPQSSTGRTDGSPGRLREIGELHFHAASYASAVDYLRSAARALERQSRRGAEAHASCSRTLLEIRLRIAECRRLQGQFPEAVDELRGCAELAAEDELSSARVLVALARVRQAQGEHADALSLAREGFNQLSLSDLHGDVGVAQIVMGIAHASMGQPRKAEEFFQDALATYRRISDVVSQAHVLNNLAILAKGQARWGRALRLYDRAEHLLERRGTTHEAIALQLNKAIVYRKMGRRVEAMAAALQGIRGARSRGDQAFLVRFCLLLGQLYTQEERFAEAEQNLLEARVTAERQGMGRELALVDEYLGDLMRALGRFDEAASNYALAEERASEISPVNDVLVEVRRRQAELALELGDVKIAVERADDGLVMADVCGEEFERGFLYRVRGRAQMLESKDSSGIASLESAAAVFRGMNLDAPLAETLLQLADAHVTSQSSRTDGLLRARMALREAAELDDEGGEVDRCAIQLALARTEMALGNHDEALLGLFEVERIGCAHDPDTVAEAEELRREIDRRMTDTARDYLPDYSLLAGLPDMVDDDDFLRGEALARVLDAACRRLGAERGCVAVRRGSGRAKLDVLAIQGMNRSSARGLAQRALELTRADADPDVRVWSQTANGDDWDGVQPLGCALAFRSSDEDLALECLVYFDAEGGSDDGMPFDAETIAVGSTLVELLRGAVFRDARDSAGSERGIPAAGPYANVITQSERVMQVLELCSKVAASPYTVLLEGETGTGKGLLARLIHDLSGRQDQPLVTVNCAAIPETLLESELFGHVKGAFTGADAAKPGLILAASGGTLFLDEVGKMPLPMQAKLLQFLDDHRVRPVGGTRSEQVDVRVICASKRDLEAMVRSEEFLEDLYYRLLDFPIEVPPLRERGADIGLLAEVFIDRASQRLGRQRLRLTRSAAALLRAYRWPGNVRELEKVITRAVLMAADEDRIRDRHLPDGLRHSPVAGAGEPRARGPRPLKEQIAELERQAIAEMLERTGWNRSEAARQLRISYPTLLQKIRTFNLKES
jgi:DNA-binding NtrC family response regulator/tetratricopeptide (TPR) repeat protein